MPQPWLDSEYRARVEAWVDKGTGTFTNADTLHKALVGTEFSAPRRIVRDVWRETVVAKEYIPLINRLDPESLIPRAWVQPTAYNYSEPYAVKVKITGQIEDSTGVTEHFATLLYDHMPTRGEIGEDYAGTLEMSNLSYTPSSLAFSITKISHRQGAVW
jgi:hypothetical protein